MPALTVRNHIGVVTAELGRALRLAFLKRYPALPNLTALAAGGMTSRVDGGLVYVTAEGQLFEWVLSSVVAADGLNIIAVTGVSQGRWLRVTSPMMYGPNVNAMLHSKQSGWARHVAVYEGDDTLEATTVKTLKQSPSLMLEFAGDRPDRTRGAARPGRYYWNHLNYTLFVTARNFRLPRLFPFAWLLSPFVEDDISLADALGDIRYFLAGADTFIDGVEYLEIGPADIVEHDLDQRVIAATLQLTAKVSFEIPDEDLEPMRIEVTPCLTQSTQTQVYDRLPFDPMNYVAAGFACAVGPGFVRSYGPTDLATVAGTAMAGAVASVTLPASSDVYRDLDQAGVVHHLAVASGEPAPPVTANCLRIAITHTDASGVIGDDFVCSRSVQFGSVIPIPA